MSIEQDFTTIYNSYAPKVQRLCLKEWLQETFIKVWKHRNSFKGKSSVETWIYRIAVNVCLGNLRKPKKSIPINEDLLSNNTADDNTHTNETKIKKMYHCIDQLNEQNRALILLELENIPQATIAATVGLANGTLRTRLSRIRKTLLKCMTYGK